MKGKTKNGRWLIFAHWHWKKWVWRHGHGRGYALVHGHRFKVEHVKLDIGPLMILWTWTGK